MVKRERNEDDVLALENRDREREYESETESAKKIVVFNQYLLVARACCVSFATTADDDFQNNATQCQEFLLFLSLSLHRVTIVRGRHCTNDGIISLDMCP